jgi:2-polyprenyl-3-methyl-5-hydroxy-6-metoxy-1,4-benzoquinol methylase
VTTFKIAQHVPWGFVDVLEVDPCGLLRVTGWSKREIVEGIAAPELSLNGSRVNLLQIYRTTRSDIRSESHNVAQLGLVIEYLLSDAQYAQAFSQVSIVFSERLKLTFQADLRFIKPHYSTLLNMAEVLHREHIYGSGPPNIAFSPEVLPLTRLLRGRVLDFGCGSGAMVLHLRSHGIDARGIELDSDLIRDSLHPPIRPYISLYDGAFPTPYSDKSFDSVYSSEVLEHIPNPEEAVAEMARLTSDRLVLTTPDISAIPIGFRSSLVPWHLLEGTHVNFFTQTSLRKLLEPYFSRIEFGRISPGRINDSTYYVSLVAFCSI